MHPKRRILHIKFPKFSGGKTPEPPLREDWKRTPPVPTLEHGFRLRPQSDPHFQIPSSVHAFFYNALYQHSWLLDMLYKYKSWPFLLVGSNRGNLRQNLNINVGIIILIQIRCYLSKLLYYSSFRCFCPRLVMLGLFSVGLWLSPPAPQDSLLPPLLNDYVTRAHVRTASCPWLSAIFFCLYTIQN